METMKNVRFSLETIEKMPVIHSGHFDNIVIDREFQVRVLHCRMTIDDGMKYNNQITVELLFQGKWVVIDQYEAK